MPDKYVPPSRQRPNLIKYLTTDEKLIWAMWSDICYRKPREHNQRLCSNHRGCLVTTFMLLADWNLSWRFPAAWCDACVWSCQTAPAVAFLALWMRYSFYLEMSALMTHFLLLWISHNNASKIFMSQVFLLQWNISFGTCGLQKKNLPASVNVFFF